ncbi:MAG: hypothetical protein KC420_01720 [Myxococcales bacterium]|nr:hypothetical protein [Myxococcales bacterium]MCB9566976.1 hypothetical protein [Myxococcales bacterium]MCB9704712.1 hypothetical protein [Myxococcales bacterium]
MSSGPAQAANIPEALRPPPENQRKVQFLFGLGPSSRVGGRGWYGYNCGRGWCGYGGGYGGAFKLHQEILFHLTGKWHGPALSLVTQEEFAGGYFGFNILPRFAWDIHVYKPLALVISPFVGLGYHLSHWNPYWYNTYFGYVGAPNYSAATLQFGVTGKLMIGQRWLVWLQFPSADFQIGPGYYYCNPAVNYCPTYFAARFDVLAGGGVAF